MDTIKLLSKLNKIHKTVFNKFQYKTDLENYKIIEKWVQPNFDFDGSSSIIGDCEDFALACRNLCRKENLTTRLVVCRVETGEGHCVLECNGWILDNRRKKVVSREELEDAGYEWIAISGYEPGDPWYRIEE